MLAPHGREQLPTTKERELCSRAFPAKRRITMLGSGPEGQTPALSVEPGRQEPLDVPAAARPLEASCDGSAFHDDQRGEGLDPEALEQVGVLLLGHTDDVERAMVPPALEHLREESLHTPAMP